MRAARRIGLEILGWLLLIAGIAALVLPGPGLLLTFAGLAVLSQQYEWAERRLDPIKYRALRGAAESVETPLRIAFSVFGCSWLFAAAVVWWLQPDQPGWWDFPSWTWLPGGKATAITLAVSGVMAAVLLGYSFRRFYNNPQARAELDQDIDEADEELRHEQESSAER